MEAEDMLPRKMSIETQRGHFFDGILGGCNLSIGQSKVEAHPES